VRLTRPELGALSLESAINYLTPAMET